MWGVLLVIFLLSGCANEVGQDGPHHVEKPLGVNETELVQIQERLFQLDEVYKPFAVQPMTGFTQDKTIYLQVRKLHKHREPLSKEEIDKLRNAIYESLGQRFPLEISSFTLPQQADITGKITSIQEKERRVLIVDREKTFGTERKMVVATWVKIELDTAMKQKVSEKPLTFEDLKVGQTVEAWSSGLMLDSYPGQTSALELNVLASEQGSEDMEGAVSKIETANDDFFTTKLIVNDLEVWLTKTTVVRIGDKIADAGQIRVGDKVKIWLLGYAMFGDKEAAGQIVFSR